MIVQSPLSPSAYRSAVQRNLENYRNFRDERFSGRFIGPVFYITHHCYTEWNRRISGEMNNAIGYLKKTETGCEVRYLHTTGFLTPFHLSLLFLFSLAFSTIALLPEQMDIGIAIKAILFLSSGVTVISALGSALSHALTENGIAGGELLNRFMADPTWGEGE